MVFRTGRRVTARLGLPSMTLLQPELECGASHLQHVALPLQRPGRNPETRMRSRCPLNRVHPTRVCCSVAPITNQPLHVLLELKERRSMEDLDLGGGRNVNARELTQHTMSPLANTPGHPWIDEAGKGHPLTSRRINVDAILVQLHLSQNVASIGSLKDELCTPKPCQIRCIYIYTLW